MRGTGQDRIRQARAAKQQLERKAEVLRRVAGRLGETRLGQQGYDALIEEAERLEGMAADAARDLH